VKNTIVEQESKRILVNKERTDLVVLVLGTISL